MVYASSTVNDSPPVLPITMAATPAAQRFFSEGRMPPRFPPSSMPDRDFAFCKLMYRQVRYEALGMGWATDYPYAGINLMIRFSELTTAQVSRDSRDEPNHWVVELTDRELFNCPFIMAADVGTIGLSSDEATQLRAYLLKGGFLWVDDFWGPFAWEQWAGVIGKVEHRDLRRNRAAAEEPCLELTPRGGVLLGTVNERQPFALLRLGGEGQMPHGDGIDLLGPIEIANAGQEVSDGERALHLQRRESEG